MAIFHSRKANVPGWNARGCGQLLRHPVGVGAPLFYLDPEVIPFSAGCELRYFPDTEIFQMQANTTADLGCTQTERPLR